MKKLLSVILVAIMVLSTISIGISVSAESVNIANETNSTSDSPLEVEVTTDKSSYGTFGVAEITVKVTNTSDETVENISAEAIFDDLAPVGRKSETSKQVESLNAEESFSFSYKATLNMNNSNLSFFEKFILWFVRLFNGGFTDEINIFKENNAYEENESTISFGGYTITNIIRYNYNVKYIEMSDEEFDKASKIQEEVSAELSDIQLSDEYKNSDTEDKKDMIESKLYEFEKNGLIKDITYNDSSCLFSFEYSSGWGGGIVIENKHTDCYSISSSNSPVIFENRTLTQHDNGNNVLFDDLNMLFVIGASANNDFNSVQYLTELINQYSNMGVNVQKKAMATVETYKNLSGYDFVYVMSHGSYSDNIPYICTTEIATYKKQNEYRKDLNSESVEIYTVDGQDYFWILPSFFVNNYQNNELDETIFYLGYCCGLGNENIENHAFYKCLKKGGAETVIGFCNSVKQSYSNYFGEKLLHYLSQGYTIFDSYNKTIEILGENQEVFFERFAPIMKNDIVAYPIILGEKNIKLFYEPFEDYGVFTATVIDEFSNDFINNVGVAIYTESGSTLLHLEKTNENGTFSIKLLPGKYSCELVHKNYITKTINFSITKNTETFFNEPISLTPTTYLMGTVIDKSTNKPVENASVLLRLLDGDSGLYTDEYTCSTDENGQFEINVPAGTYTYEINKLDLFEELYETATGTTTVNSATANILGTIYLTPKNSSGGGNEENIFSGGDGTEANPYQVSTPEQLNAVRNNLSAHYIQTADINMSEWGDWEPIGDMNSSFNGVFDGNGFDIKSLTINYTGSNSAIGLFGYANDSIVENISIISGNICNNNGAIYLGSVVGYGNEIINCRSSTKISAKCSYGGGITGFANKIENCAFNGSADFYSDTNVQNKKIHMQNQTSGYFGGICGATEDIKDSKNVGKVYACGKYETYTGGITGYASVIVECYNSGSIDLITTGDYSYHPEAYLGGISGVSKKITDCYNSGNATVKSYNYAGMVGGITGLGYGIYSSCYNVGKLSNNSKYSWYKGGIIGISHIFQSRLINCYSNISKIVGSGNVTSKYTLENSKYLSNNELILRENYQGFDFDNTWTISNDENNGYPYLSKLKY